jgi:hypothetical protein
VTQLAELWLDNSIRRRHKHPEVTERVFKRDILPALGKKNASKVTTAEVTRSLAKINASGRPTILDVISPPESGHHVVLRMTREEVIKDHFSRPCEGCTPALFSAWLCYTP